MTSRGVSNTRGFFLIGGLMRLAGSVIALAALLAAHPYGRGAIAHSIPNLWYFEDTTGAGKSDKRSVLLGRIGFEKDTHGMSGNFVRGFDGWIYATHGFNNDSTVKASDGSEIKMNSGN